MTIYFYSTTGPYGCFSNFSRHAFYLDGARWATSEHYFLAQKFAGTPYAETVRLAPTARKAAELGRRRDWPLRPDWEQVKDDVMRRAVRAKFAAYEDIRATLLATGEEDLAEATSDDYYWGVGTEGHGKNMLGKILMEVRAELRK